MDAGKLREGAACIGAQPRDVATQVTFIDAVVGVVRNDIGAQDPGWFHRHGEENSAEQVGS